MPLDRFVMLSAFIGASLAKRRQASNTGTQSQLEVRMTPTKAKRCPSCGKGGFAMADVQGRPFAYRDERALVMPVRMTLPVCTACGDIRLSGSDAARLDEALESAYVAHRATVTRSLVERLVESGWRQTDIELAMGLSQGYISKAVRGEKTLAMSNLQHLYLLAFHPRSTLSRLAPHFPKIRELEAALDRRGALSAA